MTVRFDYGVLTYYTVASAPRLGDYGVLGAAASTNAPSRWYYNYLAPTNAPFFGDAPLYQRPPSVLQFLGLCFTLVQISDSFCR